eukprot:scaffold1_cov375-Pavlova_lutheri.AAC.30
MCGMIALLSKMEPGECRLLDSTQLLEEPVGCPPLLWMVDPRERHPSHDLVARQPSSSYITRVAMAMGSVGPSVRLVDAQRGEERHGGG